MLEMGNPQVTRSWFVGILEGEGCFKNKRVTITNTNKDIIDACERYLTDNYIYFTTSRVKYKNYKEWWVIYINFGRKNDIFNYCKQLYKLIQPSLECRRDEFEQLLGTSETTCEPSEDLEWLAGIFEAEGSFSLILDYRNQASFTIEIANSNQKIIDKVIRIYRKYYISYHVSERAGKKSHHKHMTHIRIRGLLRCERFLRLMKGQWIAQRNIKRTELMKEFIDTRFQMHLRDPLTSRQLQIIQTMRDLNRKKI